jgi:hypothetical protein
VYLARRELWHRGSLEVSGGADEEAVKSSTSNVAALAKKLSTAKKRLIVELTFDLALSFREQKIDLESMDRYHYIT